MRVLIGVCGGIAAYKAAELVRLLQQSGIEVEVAMTASAERFVTPLTFAALTGRTVFTSLWKPGGENESGSSAEFQIEHIAISQRLDALVIAPATADMLAKLARGTADDFLSTLYLATTAPVIVAPAMNVNMWRHPATQENVRILRDRGLQVVEPDEGYLACGMTGSGRLAQVEAIAETVVRALGTAHDLDGETILVTAGGTREPIDPVRFIGNRSSGKMGHALAQEAARRGANVILVTASTLEASADVTVIRVSTAGEMLEAVRSQLHRATVVIGAAAVSDFRALNPSPNKLRRDGPLALNLQPTEDIMARVSAERQNGTLVVAFAAETEHLEANARAKLLRKRVDAIVANDVSTEELGFDSDRNAGLFITAGRVVTLPEASKLVMANRILDEVLALRKALRAELDGAAAYLNG